MKKPLHDFVGGFVVAAQRHISRSAEREHLASDIEMRQRKAASPTWWAAWPFWWQRGGYST